MKRTCFALLALLLCALPSHAEVTSRVLGSGALLIVDHEPDARDTVIDAFFRVGTGDENGTGDSGMSALLAHTWTFASQNRTTHQIARDISQFGGLGIRTTGEYIELWTASDTADATDAAQTLLMNLVAAPAFPADALANAKHAIDRERALRQDGLLSDSFVALRRRVFALSAFGRDPLGDPENIQAATADHLRRFYLHTVGLEADRSVFVVAGNLSPDDAEQLVMSNLAAGDWPALHPTVAKSPTIPTETDRIPPAMKTLELARPAPTRLLLVGFVAPGTAAGATSWADLVVLDAILAGGKDCRLFALRDHPADNALPIGYDIRSHLEPGRAQSLWTAYVMGTTLDTTSARDAILTVTHALADGTRPVTDDELARAKIYLKGRHHRERQRLSDRASALGWAALSGLGVSFENDYEATIDAVTLSDVNTLAKRIFSENAATVATGTEPARP